MDSVFRVRYRSSFGLKYLEIIRGEGDPAPEGFVFNGLDDETDRATACYLPGDPRFASAPSAQNGCFQPQTEFDDIGNTFDTETRTNARTNLVGFGNAFAGRGTSLNDAINSLEPLFRGLKPVSRVLTAPDTQLRRFFPELGDAARILAPVAAQQADFFTQAGIAFAAISSDPGALQETISEGVPTLETAIDAASAPAPVPARVRRPSAARCGPASPTCGRPCRCSTRRSTSARRCSPARRRRPSRLEGALRALNRVVSQPTTKVALQRLEETFDIAQPLAEVGGAGADRLQLLELLVHLPAERALRPRPGGLRLPPDADRVPGLAGGRGLGRPAMPAMQSNGRQAAALGGKFEPYSIPILNAHPYQPTGQKNADCQGGQFGYELGEGLVPGQAPDNPAYAVADLPGSRGPTTLFTNDAGERELHDTRVDSRQPETWGSGR